MKKEARKMSSNYRKNEQLQEMVKGTKCELLFISVKLILQYIRRGTSLYVTMCQQVKVGFLTISFKFSTPLCIKTDNCIVRKRLKILLWIAESIPFGKIKNYTRVSICRLTFHLIRQEFSQVKTKQ